MDCCGTVARNDPSVTCDNAHNSAVDHNVNRITIAIMSDPEQLKGESDIAFRAGKLAEARELYEAALSLRPDWVAAHNNLAMVLWQLGDKGGAESHFCSALAVDSDQIGTLSDLGALLVEQEHL